MGWPRYIAQQPAPLQRLVPGLMESQWWPERDFLAGWKFQLMLLLGWAINNVPYYQRSAGLNTGLQRLQRSQKNFWDEWRALPLLSKRELRQQGDSIRYDKLPEHHLPVQLLYTSGSTGTPVEIFNTAVTGRNWRALTIRDHLVWKRDFRKRAGSIVYLPKEARSENGIVQPDWGPALRGLYECAPSAAIHIGHSPDVHAAWLRRFNPSYLLTYPSVADEILNELGAAGKPTALEEIRFMSEPLEAELERRLADEWGVRCTDMYSANETGHIAVRCPEYNNLHVQAETNYLELLNDAGEPCRPGETGRVLITPLHNLGTTLIRYDIGDYATAGAPCGCGRAAPVIRQVLGRVRNYLHTPDGRRVWPSNLGRIRDVEAIVQAQYVQISPDSVELRMVVSRPLSEAEETQAVGLVQSALEHPFNVKLRTVDRIERGPTGKFEEFLSLANEP